MKTMNYSFEGLSLAVVQRLLTAANRIKTDLLRRRGNVDYTLTSSAERIAEDQADLIAVNQEMAALTEEIALMPDGEEKIDKEIDLSKLNTRKLQLQSRLNFSSSASLPERQYSMAILDLRIPETDAYIAALQNRITEMGG